MNTARSWKAFAGLVLNALLAASFGGILRGLADVDRIVRH